MDLVRKPVRFVIMEEIDRKNMNSKKIKQFVDGEILYL
jgi:hypothetical protein